MLRKEIKRSGWAQFYVVTRGQEFDAVVVVLKNFVAQASCKRSLGDQDWAERFSTRQKDLVD